MVEVPRNMHFELPERLSKKDRARDAVITALLWAIYLYLWVPLVSLLAWGLGFEFAYDVMIRAGGAKDLIETVLRYTVAISFIFAAFTIWSVSNRLRFQNLKRRGRREPVSIDAIAEYFRVSPYEANEIRNQRIVHLDVDSTGRPEIVATGMNEFHEYLDYWNDCGDFWPDDVVEPSSETVKKAV